MRVKIRFFAAYREIAGRSEDQIQLGEGATVGDAMKILRSRYPRLAFLTDPIATSVNRNYSTEDTVLKEGDEVAILPPVSGG